MRIYIDRDELWPWMREDNKYYEGYVDLTDEEYAELKKVNAAFFEWQEKLKDRLVE